METIHLNSGSFGVLQIALIIAVFLPILALISLLKNRFNGNEKMLWILIVIFAPFIGSILYFAIGRSKRLS
ncbi:PLD nuclease N-terminal domain-containing protein [Mangrovimonas sp. TPBH4]|uniref:PLD nuclease N-terminal domain-containing protein n=1 Tax=Mangrovimonas sp. TPBH4 TaxID=1645914 RepID=UPI0009E9DF40|nr:PLD nuclease N-terminal domain-containing protein [Mangrovimonas sp. TPBH4]